MGLPEYYCYGCGRIVYDWLHSCNPPKSVPDRFTPKPDYPRNGVQPTIPANPYPPRPVTAPLTEERIREIVREEVSKMEDEAFEMDYIRRRGE